MENLLHEPLSQYLLDRFYGRPLIANLYRGDYVEGLILFALGEGWKQTPEWSSWDLEREDGVRVEVKQSAALQSWHRSTGIKKPAPYFDIAPRAGYYTDSTDAAVWVGLDPEEPDFIRAADLYIFAWHPENNPDTADHRRAEQWQFFVVAETLLTERHGHQKTISLNPVKELATAVPYDQLAATVAAAAAELPYRKDDIGRQDAADYYAACEVMEGVRKGEVRIYSSEEVRAYLGLDR